jgi:cytochrome c-type biogenesis protein CcmH/NrfF
MTKLLIWILPVLFVVLMVGAMWESWKEYDFRKRCVYAQGTPAIKLSAPRQRICLAENPATLRVQ